MSITLLTQYLNLPWERARNYLAQDLVSLQQTVNTLITSNDLGGIGSGWVDIPFSTSILSTNSAGSITPGLTSSYVYAYKSIANLMWLNVNVAATINNTATTEIRVKLPAGVVLHQSPGVGAPVDNRFSTAALWSDAGTVGAAAAFLNFTGNYISVERWDNTTAFPNGQLVSVSFMMTLLLAP